MTDERYRTASGDETDAQVSAGYRDLARERTPDHLDKAVLRAAARAARPRYSRLRSWTRPMAWAATVVLSVALVLEISKLPAPDSTLLEEPAREKALESATEADADEAAFAPAETERPEASTPAAAAPALSRDDALQAPGAVSAGRVAAPQPAPASELEKRQRSASVPEAMDMPDPGVRMEKAETQLEQLRPQEADMLQRAEEQARTRAGEGKESAAKADLADAAPVQAFTLSTTAGSDDGADCGDTLTASPETWLECIEELEARGLADAAQRERERLARTFPEFELP